MEREHGTPRRHIDSGDGLTLAYVEAGEGPAVVLIHGMATVLDDMVLGPLETLSRKFRTIAVDRPGHGESTRGTFDASPWRQAALIRDGLDRLGVERPVIVGHSFGGAVALAIALQWPEKLAGIVAVAPFAYPELRLEHLIFGPRSAPGLGHLSAVQASGTVDNVVLPALWHGMFLPQLMPENFRTRFPFALVDRPAATIATGEDIMASIPALAEMAMLYGRCAVPVRVLAGERDTVINNLLHSRPLAHALPDARYVILPGLGHMLHHFEQEHILRLVQELAERAPSSQRTAQGAQTGKARTRPAPVTA